MVLAIPFKKSYFVSPGWHNLPTQFCNTIITSHHHHTERDPFSIGQRGPGAGRYPWIPLPFSPEQEERCLPIKNLSVFTETLNRAVSLENTKKKIIMNCPGSWWQVWKQVWHTSYVTINFTWIIKGVSSFSTSSVVFSCVFYLTLAFYFVCQRTIFHKYWKSNQEEGGATAFQMLGYPGMPIDIFADAVAWYENTLSWRSLPSVYMHIQYTAERKKKKATQILFLVWVLTETVLLADSALENQFLLWKLGANIGFCVMRAYVLH